MRLPLIIAALCAALACQTSAAPAAAETSNNKEGESKSSALAAPPPSVSMQASLSVLPAIDSKQIVVGLIEREDFEGSVADEAARARSATREGRKIVVPAEVTITSGALKVEGDLQPGRRGRIIEVGKDGIPIVHGIREPDDESDNQVWRNADVIEGKLFPGGSPKVGRALDVEKQERMPADRIQSRILTGGEVHVVEATPVEDREDHNVDSLENNSNNNAGAHDVYEYAASQNSQRYQQSHQVQPVYSNPAGSNKAVGSVEVVDLEPGYSAANKREYVQQPQKKKNRKQQQQQKFQQTQQQQQQGSSNRDDVALDAQDAGFNPSQYYNNYQQQQGGQLNGYETNYLHSAGGQDDSQAEEASDYAHPQNQLQYQPVQRPQQQYQQQQHQQYQQQQQHQQHQQQQAPIQIQQGSAPQAGQVLPNGGVVIGPANPNDFVIQHQDFSNGFSVPVPIPSGQVAGVHTQFIYEEPSSDGLADISDEIFGFTQQPPQRPINRPNRRPIGREQFQAGGNRRPPFYPPQQQHGRPQQQQFLHSHARPGRLPQPSRDNEEQSGLSRMTQNVRQAMRRRYQQLQSFVNPVVGPLRQAGKQITQNLGIADSLDNVNERLTSVVGVPGLPLVLGGALTLGALGLGAHALNNFEISVNRGGSNKRDEKAAAKTAAVTDAIEAATKAYSDSTSSATTTTASTTVKDTATTTAKSVELKPSSRQAKVLSLEELELRRRKRSAGDDPDFLSNMLEIVESPESVYYAKMGDHYATRKRSPCVGKIGCQVTSVIYPSVQRFQSDEAVPSRAPRYATNPME